MTSVMSFKMTHATKVFNVGQRVWVVVMSGAQAAKVVGKFRGKHRHIESWVSWGRSNKPAPRFEVFDVNPVFASQHNLKTFSPMPKV